MPKLIDYPRTTYAGAWELGEIVDDTGGKCAIDTAARKLNRKVSGSFKAIIGSAVKFGLLTSKRDLLTTTTLFKRIKHAYDKQEELIFHREAFLTPPLFTQLCRKFRSRELPVQMLDVMLIREFSVEEINAPGVAKAFVEGCRMVGLLDEHNIVADIDALTVRNAPRRELASSQPSVNTFRNEPLRTDGRDNRTETERSQQSHLLTEDGTNRDNKFDSLTDNEPITNATSAPVASHQAANQLAPNDNSDAIASLFGLRPVPDTFPMPALPGSEPAPPVARGPVAPNETNANTRQASTSAHPNEQIPLAQLNNVVQPATAAATPREYQIQVSGPGINTLLSITEVEDIDLAVALLEKIRRQLKSNTL